MKEIRGVLFAFGETGTEGFSWAIQDEKYITKDGNPYGGDAWSYEGLNILRTGDKLTVYDENKNVIWDGVVDLRYDPESYKTMNIHSIPNNCDLKVWASFFHWNERHTGLLVRDE